MKAIITFLTLLLLMAPVTAFSEEEQKNDDSPEVDSVWGAFQYTGHKIKQGSTTAGHGIKKGSVKAGQGIKTGGKTMGRGFKKAGREIKGFFAGD